MKQLPAGVGIISALAIFAGLWSLCTGAFSLGMVSAGSLGDVFGIAESDGLGLSSVYSVLWGVLALFFAWGLWNLRNWARIGTLVIQLINLLAAVVILIGPGGLNWVGVLFNIIIIWYLSRPHVRQTFS